MEPTITTLTDYSVATSIFACFQPLIINYVKCFWLDTITDEQKRQSAIDLVTGIIGLSLAFVVNWIGAFNLDLVQILVIGGSISLGAGEASYRGIRYGKKKIDEFKGNA